MLLLPSDEETGVPCDCLTHVVQVGPDQFQRVSAAGEPATEQLRELARAGFVGVHLPRGYGGGGAD